MTGLLVGALGWVIFDQSVMFMMFAAVVGLQLLVIPLMSYFLSLKCFTTPAVMISCAGLYATCFLPSFALLSIMLPVVKYGLFSFAGYAMLLDIDIDFAS